MSLLIVQSQSLFSQVGQVGTAKPNEHLQHIHVAISLQLLFLGLDEFTHLSTIPASSCGVFSLVSLLVCWVWGFFFFSPFS